MQGVGGDHRLMGLCEPGILEKDRNFRMGGNVFKTMLEIRKNFVVVI